MKYLFAVTLALMTAAIFKASAQDYTVTTRLSQTYTPLANPNLVTNSWDQNLFTAQDFGITYNWYHKTFKFDGNNGLLIFGAGAVAAGNDTDSTDFDMDGFFVALKARDNTSALNYQVDGSAPNRIIKLEWKNAGIDGGDTADFVNFQIWLYEANGTMEAHYGPSFIKNPKDFNSGNGGTNFTGPPVGMFIGSTKAKDQGKILKSVYLSGNPDNPTMVKNGFPALKGMPKNGTVYTFTDQTAAGLNETAVSTAAFKIYPNPARSFVNIEYGNPSQSAELTILDMAGKLIRTIPVSSRPASQLLHISTAGMNPGIYIVKIQSGDRTSVEKLVVEN